MAASQVTEDQVAGVVPCGPDPGPVLEQVHRATANGIDHLYFHQIGDDQEGFLRFWDESLRPELVAVASR